MADIASLFDIDKLMGTEINPAQQYMTPAELKSLDQNKLFDTLIGGVGGYSSQLYQNKSPLQKLFATLSGGYAGRQNAIDRSTKAVQARLGLAKDQADLTKVQNENTETEYRWRAVADQIKKTDDPFIKNYLLTDQKGAMNAMYKTMFPEAPKADFSTWMAGKALGYDLNSLKPDQAKTLYEAQNALDQSQLLKAGIDIAGIEKDYPDLANKLKQGLVTKSDVLFSNQPNAQQGTVDNFGTYMPEVNVDIPSFDLFGGTQESYNMPAEIYGRPTQTGNGQTKPYTGPGTSTSQLSGQSIKNVPMKSQGQVNYNDYLDKLQRHDAQFNTTYKDQQGGIVPYTKQYSESYIKNLLDKRVDNSAQTRDMLESFNKTKLQIDRLINHRGFDELFSAGGVISKLASQDAIEASRLWENIKSKGTLEKLVKMKMEDPNGATPFGQMNYSELKLVLDSFSELDNAGTNPDFAKQALYSLQEGLDNGREKMLDKYNILYGNWGTENFENSYTGSFDALGQPARLGEVWSGTKEGRGQGLQPNIFYVKGLNKKGQPAFVPVEINGKIITKRDYLRGKK